MTIRSGTGADARRAAQLHASSITEGFLPRLGPRFLERLYRCVVKDERSFLLVAENGGQRRRHDRRHRGRARPLSPLPAPRRRDRGASSPRRACCATRAPCSRRCATAARRTTDLPAAELLAVAVDDAARGNGLGRELVDALNAEFARRGTSSSKVVVGAANDTALHLYRGCGYRDASTVEVHRNIPSQVLVWSPPAR